MARMRHLGIRFQVLPAIPHGWRWFFDHDDARRSGFAPGRDLAVARAMREIEAAMKRVEVAQDQ